MYYGHYIRPVFPVKLYSYIHKFMIRCFKQENICSASGYNKKQEEENNEENANYMLMSYHGVGGIHAVGLRG